MSDAARRRVAVEMVAKHERALRRTARRYSICADDAEDAFQRALEILLMKAPPGEARDLIRWMQTVTKHEALAVRRGRERQLGSPRPAGDFEEGTVDWISLIPSSSDGPAERAERHEEIARSREALQTLKPAELRALTLLAEGYSYLEIGEITGYSQTKVNRCLAEGRERFRAFLSRSESGERCAELQPLLSAFCDGEADAEGAARLREHLRACSNCRATMRAYRAAPRALGALAPLPVAARSLLERLHDAFAGFQSRLPGQRAAAEAAVSQATATGGTRGAGMVGLAKLLAICAGAAGGAAACAGAGIVPAALDLSPGHSQTPKPARIGTVRAEAVSAAPSPEAPPAPPPPSAPVAREPEEQQPTEPVEAEPEPAETGALEYVPGPVEEAAPEPPVPSPQGSDAGSAAGEFGP